MLFSTEEIAKLPEAPGVYLMRDAAGKVLYVGKANSLRDRVRQYFSLTDKRVVVPYLVSQTKNVEAVLVLGEKEALLLEKALIKQHKPKYNALLKDDKSFSAFRVDMNDSFPRIELFRYRSLPKDKATYFGPYVHGLLARETFEVLHRVFPLRQCSNEEFARRKRPCILYDMHRCPAPCVGYIDSKDYKKGLQGALKFLKGGDLAILQQLEEKMEVESEALEFEKAGETLKKIRILERLREKQAFSFAREEDTDVIGLKRDGGSLTIVRLVFRGAKLLGTEEHHFFSIVETDAEALESLLLQIYDQKEAPSEILLPMALESAKTLEEILSVEKKVRLATPKRGDLFSLIKMATLNAEAAHAREQEKAAFLSKAQEELKSALHFKQIPSVIECFDCSHLGGQEGVAVAVRFVDGIKDKRGLRRFRIKSGVTGDDYASFREVLSRRFRQGSEELPPDLLIIDGGKGHLNVALAVLQEAGLPHLPVIGVAKEEGRHDRGITQEKIFVPQWKDPIILKPSSSALLFLQRIRDEAHQGALSYQKVRRKKALIRSELDDIAGIGPVKKKRLIQRFGSVAGIKRASKEDLLKVRGITLKDIQNLQA